MYIIDNMIDMGLPEGENWTSNSHREVAKVIGLCNSRITNRTSLMEVCQKINKIPQDRIEKVTFVDLASEFEVPFISLS
jgi:hypothetical protein